MKLRVDFDHEDLEQMLTQFFKSTGFTVIGMNDVLDQFVLSFPDGLTVNVEPLAPTLESRSDIKADSPTREAAGPASTESIVESIEKELEEEENPQTNGGVLTMTELMDHTPSDDDVPMLHNLLRQSEALKKDD